VVAAETEAAAIARWLGAPERAAERARFAETYAAWRAAAGELVDAAAAAEVGGDTARVVALMGEATARGLMCPFNHDGACGVYPVRPDLCRVTHALDTHENCRPGHTALYFDFIPIRTFLQRIRGFEDELHASLTPPGRRQPLADRVHALLAEVR
jgi:hypothetical protein